MHFMHFVKTMTNRKDILQRFGATLKKARNARKMTMAEMEAITGIETGNLARIEGGEKNIELTTLLKILYALEIDANTILTSELIKLSITE